MSTSRKVLCAVLATLVLAGSPVALAYTLVFKDGSTLVVDSKYRIEGERLIATLQSGTETFFDADDVDLEKTESMNQLDLGSAFVLDAQGTRQFQKSERQSPQTLADLLRARGANDQGIFSRPREVARARRTPAGNLDLFTFSSEAFASPEVSEEVSRLLRRHGVAASFRQGSAADRLLLQIATNNRGEVFAALTGSASALVEIVDQIPEIQFMELAMSTDNRSRAAMFLIGYEDAVALADGKIEPERFFLDNVLF